MNSTNRTAAARGLWIAPLVATALGCAGVQTSALVDTITSEGITQEREQRKDEAAQLFAQHRDRAELEAALAQWNRQDTAGCEESLERLIARNPSHCDAQLLLAEVYLAGNRPREAFEQAQRAFEAYPNETNVQYIMGLVLDATGRCDDALAYYQRAAQAEPGHEVYAVGYRKALEASKQVMPQAAASNRPAPNGTPTEPIPTALGGEPGALRLLSHTDPAGHADSAGSANAATRDPLQAVFQQGRAALAERSVQTAAMCFRKASSMQPDNPQIRISAAVAALQHNQPALAVELLHEAENRFSDSVALYRILGAAYYRLGDYQSSQVTLQQALSLDKSSALTYFLMGCTLAKLGQSESSEAHLRQARTLDPRFTVRR